MYPGMMSRAAVHDTIFALSSGALPAAIAVIRISGPQAGPALQAVIGRIPKPRQAALARVRAPGTDDVIDEALALWFPGPNSETGEDTAELQLHGGRAVVAATFDALRAVPGLRVAEPGEFTRRAFEHGKLDLTAVEGLADLVAADTPAQRRQAFQQMKGLLGNRAEDWRARLIQALALVEARIDFSDESDVPEDLIAPARDIVRGLAAEIGAALQDHRGERLREGLTVAIAGPPNAGKSSLFNSLIGRDAAIVSPHAGTTRDVIEAALDLGGYPVILLDTAGIRDSHDPVEQEGIRRARTRAEEADLVLWVTEADGSDSAAEPLGQRPTALWRVLSKRDLAPRDTPVSSCDLRTFSTSVARPESIAALRSAIASFVECHMRGEQPMITRARQRGVMTESHVSLLAALSAPQDEIMAEYLRSAASSLGRLTGRIDVEDVLDALFRDFCIGK